MERKSKQGSATKLAARREAYRLWFEFLRLARSSNDSRVKAALARSREFYGPWGDVATVKFDDWWLSHGHLFEEQVAVRRLADGERPTDPNSLVIEVPLTMAPTKLLKAVKAVIERASEEHLRQVAKRKNKTLATARFRLTAGAEPKLVAIREMLTVYRDVFLAHPKLRGQALLEVVHRHYGSRKQKKWQKIPLPLMADKGDVMRVITAQRNLRRYITNAEQVLLNVAGGSFPGEYGYREK
jgi:hypothetical protein